MSSTRAPSVRASWRRQLRKIDSLPSVHTWRVLRGLDSWSHRLSYAAFVVEDKLGFPYRGRLDALGTGQWVFRDGYRFEPRDGTADRRVLGPFHEVQTRSFLRNQFGKEREKGVFVDVGAHCGDLSIPFSPFFEKVLAIEPLPDNHRALSRNIRLNGLEDKIHAFDVAAGAVESRGTFFAHGDEMSSLVHMETPTATIDVTIRPLDALLRDSGVVASAVRLLKVDVEGAELDVLAGASMLLREGSPLVVLEGNTPPARRRLEEHMEGLGYDLLRVTDGRNLCFEAARLWGLPRRGSFLRR